MKNIQCPKCRAKRIWKYGLYRFRGRKEQKYRCVLCGFQFIARTISGLARHRFPVRIIRAALGAYYICAGSAAGAAKFILRNFKVKVSAQSVLLWTRKFPWNL